MGRPQLRGCGRFCQIGAWIYAVLYGRRNNDCGVAMLEAENWRIALELYKAHPIAALLLGHQLMAIKQSLKCGRKGIPDAMVGLDLALDALFPHTDFHKVSYRLYMRRLEGTIKPHQEDALRGRCEVIVLLTSSLCRTRQRGRRYIKSRRTSPALNLGLPTAL